MNLTNPYWHAPALMLMNEIAEVGSASESKHVFSLINFELYMHQSMPVNELEIPPRPSRSSV